MLAPEQMKMLCNTQADLARSQRSIKGTKIAGQSNTTQDAHAMQAHGAGGGHGNMLTSILTAALLEGGAEMVGHLAGGTGVWPHVASMATMVWRLKNPKPGSPQLAHRSVAGRLDHRCDRADRPRCSARC